MNELQSPFSTIPVEAKTRTTFLVPDRIVAQIRAVMPKTGVMQLTIDILIDKFANELRKRNITDFSPDDYLRALRELSITIPFGYADHTSGPTGPNGGSAHGVPATGPVPHQPAETPHRDDGLGTGGVGQEGQRLQAAPDAAGSSPRSGRGKGSGQRRERQGKA